MASAHVSNRIDQEIASEKEHRAKGENAEQTVTT
jgi:hypothetical protein